MALSREVRRLARSWENRAAWPKRLDWIEISRLRGWNSQRIAFQFPIVAIVGENGSGKSTVIQAAASVYQKHRSKGFLKQKGTKYPSDFFPATFWDHVSDCTIQFGYTEGSEAKQGTVRKKSERWKGNPLRPLRDVTFLDLSRIVPVSGRLGYAKIVKSRHVEATANRFDEESLARLSNILGHVYEDAKMASSSVDPDRQIPVLARTNASYSGYHQGQGETTIAELIQANLQKYGLVLIDEIESSLHPSAQRRLVQDLATVCRERELQIILTTHSRYVLDELPREARILIFNQNGERQAMTGVSPECAVSKMDDTPHPECEIYMEDKTAQILLKEIISQKSPDLASRLFVTPCGAASVGYKLGEMVSEGRFPRAVGVFLDGDCAEGKGCCLLPGEDAPEMVVFEDLKRKNWGDLWTRIARTTSSVTDACNDSMTLPNHHDWIVSAANKLMVGKDILWHTMCAEWVKNCLSEADYQRITRYIEDRLSDSFSSSAT